MSDEWIIIEPGGRYAAAGQQRVTLAWRQNDSRIKGRSGFAGLSKALVKDLGWPGAKLRVEIACNADGTMVRARPSATGFRVSMKQGAAAFPVPLAWVESETRSAQAVQHEVRHEKGAGGVLLITLPEWARKPAEKALPVKRGVESGTKAQASAAPATVAPPPAEELPKWSDARNEVLRRLYPAGASVRDILAEVNALPGPEATDAQCYAQANALGLRRIAAAVPQTKYSRDRGAVIEADKDKAEAVKLLEAGMSARQVADEMGLGLSVVSNWAAEVRDRQNGKAA